MTPEEGDEPPGSLVSPEYVKPVLEEPDVPALLEHVRWRERARWQRRRRHALIAVGGLLGGCAVLVAVLRILPEAPRKEAPPTPEALMPYLAPARENDKLRPQRSGPPAVPERMASAGGEAASRLRLPAPAPPKSSSGTVAAAGPVVSAAVSAARDVASLPDSPPPAASTSPPETATLRYQPSERLLAVRPGDAKEHIFDLFGSTVESRNGTLVRIEGMRLRASGRSPEHRQVEVGDVDVADTGAGTRYWFLFGDGRLVAWGRPEEWPPIVARYQLEIDYR